MTAGDRFKEQGVQSYPSILSDNQVHSLLELIDSDFAMDAEDADYGLTLIQMIKVSKILLHKVNFNQLRNAQDNQINMSEMRGLHDAAEAKHKSALEEINQSIQGIVQSIESFAKKTIRDTEGINQTIDKCIQEIFKIKNCIEKFAVSHVALLESSKIGLALKVKDVDGLLSTGQLYLSDQDDPFTMMSGASGYKMLGAKDINKRYSRLTQAKKQGLHNMQSQSSRA